MNKIAKYLKALIFVNFLFYGYSVNAETWCGFASPLQSFTYSSCAPSPEFLTAPFCSAWANGEAGTYYNLTSNDVVIPTNPYYPEPPLIASIYRFGCAATGTPVDAFDPLGLGPLNSSINGLETNLAPYSYALVFIEGKSAEFKGCSDPKSTDFVRISTGENLFSVIDYKANKPSKIDFIRYYNSFNNNVSLIAQGWSHNFEKNITFETDSLGLTAAKVMRIKGRFVYFTKTAENTWVADNDVPLRLMSFPDQYELSLPDDSREIYNLSGQLIAIVDLNGYRINLDYDLNGLLIKISDSINYSLIISYTPNNKIRSVGTSDGRRFIYNYTQELLDNSVAMDGTINIYKYDNIDYPNLLTGIADQYNARKLTWNYDNLKRVSFSERLAITGFEGLTYSYPSNINSAEIFRTVSNSKRRTNYRFNLLLGVPLLTSVDGDGFTECDKGYPSYSYDPVNANVLSKTVSNKITQYSNYDEKHNAQTIIKGFGTPEAQTTSFTHNTNFYQRVATKTEASVFSQSGNKVTSYSYDGYGNIINISVDGFTFLGLPVNRSISYEYNGPLKQLSLIDGPRPNTPEISDIKRFEYYDNTALNGSNRARLRSVNNAGVITRSNIQYTTSGKISSELKTNDLVISNEYYLSNDRLKRYTETVGSDSRSVTYNYSIFEGVSSILFTGAATYAEIRLDYYLNDQLMGMNDALYNSIFIERDNENNVTRSEVYNYINNGSQTAFQAIEQTFNPFNGRLKSVSKGKEIIDFAIENRQLDFASISGLNSSIERLDTVYIFDGLSRLNRLMVVPGFNSFDAANTEYRYGLNDMLASVIEPNQAFTNYFYDDLGNLLTTSVGYIDVNSFEYDAAGNVIQKNTANNNITAYSYDSLNRIISITGNNSVNNIIVSYDNCLGGMGRLCSIQDASGLTKYQYDGFGRMIKQTHIELGVSYETGYQYDLLDRLLYTQYPSGRVVTNFYGSSTQIESIDTTMNGIPSVIIDNAKYTADGKISSFVYANGYSENRLYNAEGHLQSQSMPKKIADIIAPVITTPSNISVEATALLTPVSIGTATAVDNIDGVVIATANNTGPFPLGVTAVTWTALDATGNIATATQTVTVNDFTAPTINPPVNMWFVSDVAIAVTLGSAIATDIFSPLSIINDAPALFPVGLTTVIWKATDANGNSATATQTITVTSVEAAKTDLILPIVTAPDDLIVEASAENTPVSLGVALAIDNVDGYITAIPDQSGSFEIGTYDILWTAVDSNGNHGTATQTVVVQDTTLPIMTAPADITIISDVSVEIDLGLATASDIFLDEVVNDAPDPFPVGTTIVTWTATDINNNSATATQIVTVTPVALNNSASFKAVSLWSVEPDNSDTLSDTTFDINPELQSVVLISMVSNNTGETLPAKVWYRASKYSRWIALDISQVSNFIPDVMMVVSDSQLDLWQVDTTTKKTVHKKQNFDGRAWVLSQSMKTISRYAWLPSQPDATLRPEVTWTYQYDERGNIIFRTFDDVEIQIYHYDAFNRLTDDILYGVFYQYDSNNNLTLYSNYISDTNLSYILGSNILKTNGAINIETDNYGNIINDGKHIYSYDNNNRLNLVDSATRYVYNAFGQRTRKITPFATIIYHYNSAGQLISESDQSGAIIREYVYLGNQPIAVYGTSNSGQSTVAYIHTDNLFTPRRISNALGKVIWSWDSNAYGETPANEDPDGDGALFEMNLRFYGQYFDKESGLHNNNDKYYDPNIGRYITVNNQNIDNEMNKFVFLSGNPFKRPDLYCIRNQHRNRNFDLYNEAIKGLYESNESNLTGLKGYQKEGITNSITTIFNQQNTNCNQLENNLGDLLKNKNININNNIKIKIQGVGFLKNKKNIFEVKEP